MEFISHSVSETTKFASQFAKDLEKKAKGKGLIVGLQGDLGAGKTTFVKGMAKGLGLDPQRVTSPTFTIINEYGPLVHIDFYRLEKETEIALLGWEEYLQPGRLVVIEWPERDSRLKKIMNVSLRITRISQNERKVEITHDL